MRYLISTVLTIVGASALPASRAQAQSNVLEVVVVNGPHAGTYKPPASEVMCVHYKKQQIYAATWRNLDEALSGTATPGKNPANEVTAAAIKVSNPDAPGAKFGELRIAFGHRDGKQAQYTVDETPLTLTIKGKGAEITSQGKTKDGIQIRVTAKCSEVETF